MPDRDEISRKMQEHYESVWSGDDPWSFSCSDLDHRRYARQLELLTGRQYDRALEIGCGGGYFTRMLAPSCRSLVAVDVAPAAVARARKNAGEFAQVELRACDIMKFDVRGEGPWSLVVLSETIYSLGWLYPFFDIGWLASEMFAATEPGGRLLLVNTYGQERDYLLAPWLIDTYRDLFLNIGYQLESEEIFEGDKDEVRYQVLLSLFQKPTM